MHILNYDEWRGHIIQQLRRQFADSGDDALGRLLNELIAYPAPPGAAAEKQAAEAGIAVPLRLSTRAGTLAFLSTIMVFGTATDITLAEIAIETFLPADTATAELLPRLLG